MSQVRGSSLLAHGFAWSTRFVLLIVSVVAFGGCLLGEDPERDNSPAASATEPSHPLGPAASPEVLARIDPRPGDSAPPSSEDLPWAERVAAEQALAARDPRYAPREIDGAVELVSPRAGKARIAEAGATVELGSDMSSLVMAVASVGREGANRAVTSAAPRVVGPEVLIARGAGATEWWRALPSGLEHGLTLESRPAGDGPLVVEVEIGGGYRVTSISPTAVALNERVVQVARYENLLVTDASGATVPAHMEARGSGVRLVIEDGNATYPLVIDPVLAVAEASLQLPGAARSGRVGHAVALSGDGTRAIVGAPHDSAQTGAAQVLRWNGSSWDVEATLLASDGAPGDQFGYSVSMTADGSRAVVGAPLDDTPAGTNGGSLRVFVRTGSTWTEESTVIGLFAQPQDQFGWSASLSSDGSRVLVGAPSDDTELGANFGTARVFLRTGTTWTEEATLEPAPFVDQDFGDGMGASVSLTGDGSRAVAGSSTAGMVRTFVRVGSTWTQEARLPFAGIGETSVAVNGDGTRAVVGVPNSGATGRTSVMVRSGSTWTLEAMLVASDARTGEGFGHSVSVTSDGSRVVVGSPLYDSPASQSGTARVFLRTGVSWSEETSLIQSGASLFDQSGYAVSISSDGGRALVGVVDDDTAAGQNAGSVRAFARAGTTWSEQATTLADGAAPNDNFGFSAVLTSDGSRALVGASQDSTASGSTTGSARVFTRTGSAWSEEATLLALGAAPGDNFGHSLAVTADGTRAVLGAPGDETAGVRAGSARVFARSGASWVEEATLIASGGAVSDQVGYAVSVSSDGTRAVVGAPFDDTAAGSNAGSARVFVRSGTTWTEEATLLASGAAAGDFLGISVSLSSDGSRAVVGAYADDTPAGSDAGSARVFLRSGTTWTQEATLLASGAGAGDSLGISVSVSSDGSRAVVGATLDDTPAGSNAGSVRVFVRSGTTWTEEATLLASGAAADDSLGSSVSLSSDGARAVVSAKFDDTAAGSDAGSARIFVRSGTTWTEEATLLAPVSAANDYFGHAVAMAGDGSRAVVATPYDDTVGSDTGSAQVFTLVYSSTCDDAADCGSGFCVDGFCCDSACGAGASSDCQACSIAAGGAQDGVCTALSSAVAPTVTCRTVSGACDAPEVCTTASTTCPADAAVSPGTACGGAPSGECDAQDTCSGSVGATAVCVANFRGAGTSCRVAANACDVAESCTGSSAACPADLAVAEGTACGGAPSGACDAQDTCFGVEGANAVCTANFRGPDTTCRSSAGLCDPAEQCTGSSATCPDDALAGAGTPCRAPVSACDATEVCAGSTATCPSDLALPPGSPCGGAPSGACDRQDTCTGNVGATATCAAIFAPAGTECRPATGDCDLAETCAGATTACPIDGFAPAGADCADDTVCTTDDSCDDTGSCVPGPELACDDGNACTAESCDALLGCEATNVDDDTPCDDGSSCSTGDRCVAGVCTPTAGQSCDDSNDCTANDCDGDQACLNTPLEAGEACSDGDACTAGDACDGDGACAGEQAVDCDDGNECSADSCNSTTGCAHEDLADGTPCAGGSCMRGACNADPGVGGGGGSGGGDGGASGSGGASGAGGASQGTGGSGGTGAGGGAASGGSNGSGGAPQNGAGGSGSTSATGSGGAAGRGDDGGSSDGTAPSEGCSCRTTPAPEREKNVIALLVAALGLVAVRRTAVRQAAHGATASRGQDGSRGRARAA